MPIVIAFQQENLDSFLTFRKDSALSQINPTSIYLVGMQDINKSVARNFERVAGVELIFWKVVLDDTTPHFSVFLEAIHQIIMNDSLDKYYILIDNSPMEFLLAGFVLTSFYDLRIVFDHYVIPSQFAILNFEKKRKILQLIWENHPQSMTALINLMKDLPTWENWSFKNLRAKVSYDLGRLEREGFLIYEVGTQGRITPKFTKLGEELMKMIENKIEEKVD